VLHFGITQKTSNLLFFSIGATLVKIKAMTAEEIVSIFFNLSPMDRMEALRYILKNMDVAEFLAVSSTLEDEYEDDIDFENPNVNDN
jgi:hypothetical protein